MKQDMIVRMVAGIFVLSSVGLGWWIHPAWLLMTAFVGLNLLQSSFTGFCPLMFVLSRMEQR
ncbi:MAG: Rhodanese-related sulfurtransferase [Fibrobacterota bacterium]|jgi:hypothetical protein